MWEIHKQHRPLLFPFFFFFPWKGKMLCTDTNTKGHNWPLQFRTHQFRSLSCLRGLNSHLGTVPAYQVSGCCSAGFPYSLPSKLFPAASGNNSWGQGGAEQDLSLGVKAQCQDAHPHSAPVVGWLFSCLFTWYRAGSVGKTELDC